MTSTLYPALVAILRANGCVFVRQGKVCFFNRQSSLCKNCNVA
mgnify:CR=1 FL=1